MACDTTLAAVLAKLTLENKELQERLSLLDGPKAPISFNVSSSKEHLERELQRSRSKHDQALQERQQQVHELEQLTLQCQEMLQGSGCRKQSPAQRTIGQLEAQLVATGRHMQCAVRLQHYLQQAEQQHKQELSEAEAQVEALRGALGKAQQELQQAKNAFIKAKTKRSAAKQASTAAEQQLTAGRSNRATLQGQLAQQCELLVPGDAAGGWDQITDLCAAMPAPGSSSASKEWLAEAAALAAVYELEDSPSAQQSCLDPEVPLSCLRSLLVHFGSSSSEDLVARVQAILSSQASLCAAVESLQQ